MISIVIPAYNEQEHIARCVNALLQQTKEGCESEIIVVDDGSTDATGEIALASGARVLQQPNQGAAAARNNGVRNARGEIVLFIDADCEPDVNWLTAMTAPFSDPLVVGSGGMKQTRQTGFMPKFIQMEFDYRYDQVRSHRYIDFVDSGTAAYRRDVFLANDGFDTSLSDAEDVELSFRLSEQGLKMAFARDAVVFREHPSSLGDYLRLKFTYAFWRSFVYKRFPRKMANDSRTPQTQKIQSGLALFLPLLIVMALVWPQAGILIGAAIVLFLVTTLGFVTRYWKRDWKVALCAPIVIMLAAFAVGGGIALGFLNQQTSKWIKRLSPV